MGGKRMPQWVAQTAGGPRGHGKRGMGGERLMGVAPPPCRRGVHRMGGAGGRSRGRRRRQRRRWQPQRGQFIGEVAPKEQFWQLPRRGRGGGEKVSRGG